MAQQFTVYTLDLIGFGESRGSRFVLREAAQLIARWMDVVGIARAHVIGHSMGGFIAADLAAEQPERVDRLVLVDAAALPFNYSYVRHLFGLTRAARYMPINFLPVLATDALRAGPLTLLRAAHELLHTDIRSKLGRVCAPTLIVWGEHDTLVPLTLGRQIDRYINNASFTVVNGAGHNPMWDRPETFNRLVIDFLLQQPDATTGVEPAATPPSV
jgi:pimeloyl-ACP methyl ester carboxylesterase